MRAKRRYVSLSPLRRAPGCIPNLGPTTEQAGQFVPRLDSPRICRIRERTGRLEKRRVLSLGRVSLPTAVP